MNTRRHTHALICVLAISSAFASSASAGGLGISTAYLTAREARAEFRAMLRTSPALRLDHDKRIVRTTLRSGGPLGLLGGTFLAMPVALASLPAAAIVGGVTAGAFLAAGAADSRAAQRARVTTAQSMVKRGMIKPATFERWSKAGLFGGPESHANPGPLAGSLRVGSRPSGLEGSLRVGSRPSGLVGSLRVSP